jgi:fatty acid desaturase
MSMQTTLSPSPVIDLNDPALLRQVNALRRTDNVTNWLYLAREYLFLAVVIGATIALYHHLFDNGLSLLWAVVPTVAAILCVGAGQHRLATLTHEAAHYMLFKNRLLNEVVSEWFCMFPILGSTHSYRVQHLGHHQHPNDPERDPDFAQMGRSGHRYQFPMSRPAFVWHCFVKLLLWPPSLIRYVLVRASFLVDQGPDTPYRMIRRQWVGLRLIALAYHLALVAVLVHGVVNDDRWLLAWLPAAMLAGVTAFYLAAPRKWFAEFAIKSDLPVRAQNLMRFAFNSLALSAIAWLTLLTGRPCWLYALLLWIVPLGSSFAFFMVVRQIVQHGNADRARLTNTRVFLVHPLLRLAVFPIGNDYHLPHHLFPLVPHYRLKELHELLQRVDVYRTQAVVVKGYFVAEAPPAPTVVDVMTR